MKKLVLTIFFALGLSWAVYAAEDYSIKLDPQTKALCNKVIINIYKDILKVKGKYPQLKNFDDKVFYENEYGIYTILYKDTSAEGEGQKNPAYEFGLTIDGLTDNPFPDKPNTFNFAFPLLGLKFSGYQPKHVLRSQFDVLSVINKNGVLLSDYQQKFMPLQLTLKTLKDTYKIREDIEFEVVLKNVSNRHMVVKSLGIDTLYFVFEDMVWGTSPNTQERGGKNVILKSGESLTLKFKGESFQKPRDIQIYCAYRMSIKGVNPSGTLRVRVVDDSDHPASAAMPQANP